MAEDPRNAQKRTLSNMCRVDTNIFRDVSTTKAEVPTDEAINSELQASNEIKILRLRSCAHWIDYVALKPSEPAWHKKQQALLNTNNPIDSLVKSGFHFLDVNDLASVNRVNEENATLHQKNVSRVQRDGDTHDQVVARQI